MEAKLILKYKNKTISQLLKLATKHFNAFIRNRDRQGDYFYCPTCKKTKRIEGTMYQACHLFPAGHYPWIRFNEDNLFGGCLSCNYFKHGAGHEYADWVRNKIGEQRYLKLKRLNDYHKQHGFKWDRFALIEIITKYKS